MPGHRDDCTMLIFGFALLELLRPVVGLSPSQLRRETDGKYCSSASDVCYPEQVVGNASIVIRTLIPDTPAESFDVLLQLVAPNTAGWVGIA